MKPTLIQTTNRVMAKVYGPWLKDEIIGSLEFIHLPAEVLRLPKISNSNFDGERCRSHGGEGVGIENSLSRGTLDN